MAGLPFDVNALTQHWIESAVHFRPYPHDTGWRALPWAIALQNRDGPYCVETDTDGIVEAKPGEGFFITSHLRHRLFVAKNQQAVSCWTHFGITASGGLDLFQFLQPPLKLPQSTADVIGHHSQALAQLSHEKSGLRRSADASGHIGGILSALSPIAEAIAPKPALSRLQPAVAMIEANLEADLSRPLLARECGLSAPHFAELFQKAFGMAPIQYVRQRRIEKARELLLATDYSVAVISERCGFSSPEYFSRYFLHATGQRPSHYRQMRYHS